MIPKYSIYYNGFWKKWEFTGRIRYRKYKALTFVDFEIKYEETDRSGFWSNKQIEVTEWVEERMFLLQEIPEETIYQCPK